LLNEGARRSDSWRDRRRRRLTATERPLLEKVQGILVRAFRDKRAARTFDVQRSTGRWPRDLVILEMDNDDPVSGTRRDAVAGPT